MTKQYEYKTVEIDPKEGFLTGVKRRKLPDFAGVLNAEGKDGWMLVQILTPDLAQGVWAAKTGRFVALLPGITSTSPRVPPACARPKLAA